MLKPISTRVTSGNTCISSQNLLSQDLSSQDLSSQDLLSPKLGIGNALNKILSKYSSCSFSGIETKLHEKEKISQDTKRQEIPTIFMFLARISGRSENQVDFQENMKIDFHVLRAGTLPAQIFTSLELQKV